MIDFMYIKVSATLRDLQWQNEFFKLTKHKKGFLRILISSIDMRSQTLTRQIFPNRDISDLKWCGNREDGMAYI